MEEVQKKVCEQCEAGYHAIKLDDVIGVSNNIESGIMPLNGLRHSTTDTTSGWYIWAGDYKEDKDFFQPVHAGHLVKSLPEIEKYLGLAPGWRFIINIDEKYEDVWQDLSLILDE